MAGDDKQPLLSTSSTEKGSSSAATPYGTVPSGRKQQQQKQQKGGGGGGGLLSGLFSVFDTENSRTSVCQYCSTGSCSHCSGGGRSELKAGWQDGCGSSVGSVTPPRSPTTGEKRKKACPEPCLKECCKPRVEMNPNVDQTIVRSTLACRGICCASEIPELRDILSPVKGIAEVKVNVPVKQIIVDHDSRIISASEIVQILNDELFPSSVVRDGGATLPAVVSSTFSCRGICCSSEVPSIKAILEPFDGVRDVKVNVPLKKVIVEHDCKIISADQIATVLTNESFETAVESDGRLLAAASGGSKAAGVAEGRSKFHVSSICCASEIPAIRTILEPFEGVKGLIVNVPTKMVYVDHVTSVISADEINQALNSEGFESEIKFDCFKDAGGFLSSFVISKFAIRNSNFSKEDNSRLKSYLQTYDNNQIEGYQIDSKTKSISIIHNPLILSAEQLRQSVEEKSGVQTTVEVDGNDGKVWDFPKALGSEKGGLSTDGDASSSSAGGGGGGIRPAVVVCGVFWIASMFSNLGGKWEVLSYLGIVSVLFGIPPIAKKAFRTARRGMIDTNILMFLAVVGAVSLRQYDEAAAVTFLFSLSEWLEDRATTRANAALTSIVNLKPETANIIQPKTKELVVVQAASVPVGAMVAVRSGDKIPCDGVVVEGTSTVDESSLTGESRPVKKTIGNEVSGGTVNSGNTQIVVRTTRTSDDSAVSRLIRLVEEAQANRSETEKIVDSFAKVYTPVVVLASFLMCTIPWYWGPIVGQDWMGRGLSLIVIACPCALVISTPISYVAGLAATAQNGVLIKGGAYLEALGQLKHICFDKTGTLTVGEFKLLKLDTIGNGKNKREKVLQYLALMEERATHPLAKSLVDGTKAEGITIPASLFVKDHTFMSAEGVVGFINDSQVHVGNEKLFRRLGLYEKIPADQRKEVESWEGMGGTVGFMSIGDDGIVCAYCVADAPRPETKQVLRELKKMGMSVTMLTGDKQKTALSIGREVGLVESDVRGELLPEEKLSLVSNLKASSNESVNPLLALFFTKPRLVLMCGDGVNDAPSLAAADVGVAMGAGAALAMETADVTLMDSQLTKLSYSIRMGKSVIRKIRENIVFSIVVKLIVLGLTLMNKVGLWAAIGSDVGSMIIVTLNGMSLLPKKKKPEKNNTGGGAETV